MLLLAAAPADAAADNYLLAAACWLLPIMKHIIFAVVTLAAVVAVVAVVALVAVVAVVAVIAVFAVLVLVAVFTAQNMPNSTCYFNDAVVSMYYDVNTSGQHLVARRPKSHSVHILATAPGPAPSQHLLCLSDVAPGCCCCC